MPTTRKRALTEHDRLRAEITSREATVAELSRALEVANKRADDNYNSGIDWRKKAEALEKTIETARDQNDSLREELMQALKDRAEAQGYIQRVLDLDPQPEPVMVPMPPAAAPSRPDRRYLMDGYRESAPRPWYLRDRPARGR